MEKLFFYFFIELYFYITHRCIFMNSYLKFIFKIYKALSKLFEVAYVIGHC